MQSSFSQNRHCVKSDIWKYSSLIECPFLMFDHFWMHYYHKLSDFSHYINGDHLCFEITLVKRIFFRSRKNINGLLLFNFCFTRYFIYSAPVDANCTKSMKFTWIFIRKVIPIHYLFACLYWKYIISCYRIKAYFVPCTYILKSNAIPIILSQKKTHNLSE
jgi:hypothetical protein